METALREFFAGQPEVMEWGVASLEKPLPNAANLQAWVGQGFHAGLPYMENRLEERSSPTLLFPWARNAVLFAMRQPAPFGSDTGDFRVASYALGEDYHLAARRILKAAQVHLTRALAPEEIRFEGFSDTWPVFERDLGAEAGLGWRGKNACLIHRRHGSGFLLAGFFTDLDLNVPATPAQDFCGGCTACLDACPTDALFEPGRLDASKCLSYWTIEAKGDIPADISEKSEAWIFGCDICQDVCPWNRKHKKDAPPDPAENRPRTALEWLSLLRRGGGFQSRFKNTPLLRAGRRSLLRNVLIALRHGRSEARAAEKIGDLSDLSDLLDALSREEDDPIVLRELRRTHEALASSYLSAKNPTP